MTEWAQALILSAGPKEFRPHLRSKPLKQHLSNLGQPRTTLDNLGQPWQRLLDLFHFSCMTPKPPSTATKYCSDIVHHGPCHAEWRRLHLAASLKVKCFKSARSKSSAAIMMMMMKTLTASRPRQQKYASGGFAWHGNTQIEC